MFEVVNTPIRIFGATSASWHNGDVVERARDFFFRDQRSEGVAPSYRQDARDGLNQTTIIQPWLQIHP